MMMTDEKKQAYTVRITQANPTQLCVILYEILLDYLGEGQHIVKETERHSAVHWTKAGEQSASCWDR